MPGWNQNRFTSKLGIEYPINQRPPGGLSSQQLTAAVSNFGGLGWFWTSACESRRYIVISAVTN